MMDEIKEFFPKIPGQVLDQLEIFCQLITKKNEQINLISRKNINQIVPAHLLPSLAIYKKYTFEPESSVLDIGTGGGFPGVPLAIVCPQTHFTLVDSIGKKIKAVEEVVHILGLKNITCCHCRVESLPNKFDVIVGRAVTNWADFQNLAVPKLRHNGTILYLSGGEIKTDDAVEKVDLFEMFNRQYCETKILLVKKMRAQKNPSEGPFKK